MTEQLGAFQVATWHRHRESSTGSTLTIEGPATKTAAYRLRGNIVSETFMRYECYEEGGEIWLHNETPVVRSLSKVEGHPQGDLLDEQELWGARRDYRFQGVRVMVHPPLTEGVWDLAQEKLAAGEEINRDRYAEMFEN
jgi:hypothetical protein